MLLDGELSEGLLKVVLAAVVFKKEVVSLVLWLTTLNMSNARRRPRSVALHVM